MGAASRLRVLSLVACLAAAVAWSQDERQVSISPERPEAGSAFVVEVTLPGERPEAVSPLEPGLIGPARYAGADVRPGPGDQGTVSTIVAYRFVATGAGRIDIVDLSARSGARVLRLGSWILDAVAGEQVLVRRYGSWSAPASVTVRDLFTVVALDPDGRPVDCPTFAVEGALFEPVPGSAGSFRAVAIEPGTMRLPGLAIGGEADGFELRARNVVAKRVPEAGEAADAVGGPWRLALAEPKSGTTARPGQAVAWDVRAVGRGWPGLASPPSLTIEGPDGKSVPAGDGSGYSGRSDPAPGCYSGSRGTFTPESPGVYVIRPEPYRWFDPASGALQVASAPAVRVVVAAPPAVEWQAPGDVAESAERSLARLAAADPAWAPALEAARRSDWPAAKAAAFIAAGMEDSRGALSATPARGTAAAERVFAAAAASLLAGDRAEAYAAFLRLERAAFPARGVSLMADAAAASFGNLERVSHVLPPFGWLLVSGAPFAAVALLALVAAFALRASAPARSSRRMRVVAAACAVVAGAALSLAGASAFERTRPRFVSLGATSRAVPSDLAEEGRIVEPGRTGRVLRSAGAWSFVEIDGGGAAWLPSVDIASY